jgi:D-alanine-D-alanine ligase-like ATP-grasp enzyme
MDGLMRRAAVAAGAAAMLLGPAAGMLGASGAEAGTRPPAGAGAVAGGAWGKAEEVPGTAALNVGFAVVNSVSCAAAGTCSAGGSYLDESAQAFVVSEVGGTWGTAKQVPGIAALTHGGRSEVTVVSCASAGNCSAGGDYTSSRGVQAFVVNEVNGTWGKAEEVPGTAALNTAGSAAVASVSCATAGNCSASGTYGDGPGGIFQQAFVVNEVNGTWGNAREAPGTSALNQGGVAQVISLSCPTAGNCSGGGYYRDRSLSQHVFVISEVNGTWGTAKQVPGIAKLNTGRSADMHSVSCASAGNCLAGGNYTDKAGRQLPFLASEVNGTWGAAREVPGIAALDLGPYAQVTTVSCGAAGNCSAGGTYDRSGHAHVFVVNEAGGTWGTAKQVPGVAKLAAGGPAFLNSISCSSAGNCSAGGQYSEGPSEVILQAFVVSEVNGTWGTAEEVPGTAALNQGGFAEVNSVSCAPGGNCSAGGTYLDSSGSAQAFVVNKG